MRKQRFIILFILTVLFLPGLAQAQNFHEKCTIPTRFNADIEINANTGKLITGRVDYPNNTPVGIALLYKNPYKYDYKWQVTSENIEAAIIGDGLKFFGLPNSTTQASNTPAPTPQIPPPPAPGTAGPCASLSGDLKTACDLWSKAEASRGLLDGRFRAEKNSVDGDAKTYNDLKALVAKDIDSPKVCTDVANGTENVLVVLPNLISLKTLRKIQEDFIKESTTIRDAETMLNGIDCSTLAGAEKTTCETEKSDNAGSLKNKIQDTKNKTQQLGVEITTLVSTHKAKEKEYKEFLELAQAVQDANNAFVDTYVIPASRSPMKHSIFVIRTPRAGNAKPETLGSVVIIVGRSRFTLSAGVGFSFINDPTFGRQNGRDADGNVKPVFAITEESDTKIGGVVQLNACLSKCSKDWAFHWSLGMGVGIGDEDADFNFYTGPSLGFLDDQFFVTFAYHQRDVTELANGFTVGEVIPEEIMEGLPTTKKSDQGLLLTFTYKFR